MKMLGHLMKLTLGERLPRTDGEQAVRGLQAAVRIRRDRFGVPYILAEHEADAWYGLGYCHGQDRAFQLETLVRLVRGSLAEIFGERVLALDRMSRRIGLLRAGEGHLAILSDGQRDILQAYVQGLNAGQQFGAAKRAHEFALLRAQPTPWRIADVLGYMNYMSIALSSWTGKLTRLFVLREDGPDALRDLDPEYPEWLMVTHPVKALAGLSLHCLLEDVDALTAFLGSGMSNNWALGPARTASGKPVLANDPHLAPRLPAPWYLAHIRCPGLSVAGASFAGMPLVPSGFNGKAAWGVTAGLVDGIDLFVEQLDQAHQRVVSDGRDVPCQVLREQFKVKGRKEPFEEDILITPRGPIISDLMNGFPYAISMKATWMQPRPVSRLTDFHKVGSFEAFRACLGELSLASQNMVYADVSNTIGWQLVGDAPRRAKGFGLLPSPGWDSSYDWGTDLIPQDEMPWAANPKAGFIATANNPPRPSGEGPYIGRDFLIYRHARIVELLDARSDWDLDSMRRLQVDRFSLPWREIRPLVLAAEVSGPVALAAQRLLASWDGMVSAASAGAAVYEYFMIAMAQAIACNRAPRSSSRVLGEGFSEMFSGSLFYIRNVGLVVKLLREQPEGWFEGGWLQVIEASLADAYLRLSEALGPETDDWRWGDVHQLVLRHEFGRNKWLGTIFNRGPYPTGGDHETVAQAGRSVSRFGSKVTGLANLRMAVEVGNWENNYFVLAGGQSGNPFSPHYDDQLQRWLKEDAISIAWSEEEIIKRQVGVLKLVPVS